MNELTERQAKLHEFLCERWQDPPTLQEMADHMEVAHRTGVMCHLNALADKGYIERPETARTRGIKLLIGPDLSGSEIEIAGRMYRLIGVAGAEE